MEEGWGNYTMLPKLKGSNSFFKKGSHFILENTTQLKNEININFFISE